MRPEKISLDRTRAPGPNVFEGEVRQELFRGAVDQILVRLPCGLELTALVTGRGLDRVRLRPGEHIFCQVHPEDLVVVEERRGERSEGLGAPAPTP
jgi:spermidine/putrescine transport system ATP-binding protein